MDQSQNLFNLLTNPLKDSGLPGQETCGYEPYFAQSFEYYGTSFRGNDLPGQGIGDQSQNLVNLSSALKGQ